ncbi:MAG: L-2-amino-thiazoline-4-carboxylic acid hydrolase [Deltaproteobacteria bacterium]|jgi:hypothetical protein|nr:L-2-amino-thiazoline-4-carboxylic acid hydrolase [Deltaproteobacteria bacterium]
MDPEISLLERRKIEAKILEKVYAVLKEEEGEPRARELLTKAIQRDAISQGQIFKAQEKQPTGTRSLAALQPLWQRGRALKTRIIRLDDEIFEYVVDYCAYCKMYQELGLLDLGYILSCERDGAFILGYAPELTLTRSRTIMTGDKTCEFLYQKK